MRKKAAILCIDDETIILESLKSQIHEGLRGEYVLEFAEDAMEGFEVIDELVDDGVDLLVIVSDWLMPGMKGDEFLVKVHEKYPQIVKVMLTGQANKDAIENAKKNADLFKCLYKPWDKEELLTTIKKGLARFKKEEV